MMLPVTVRDPEILVLPVVPETAKRAEEVAVAPRTKSSVILVGARAPEFLCQKPEMLPEEMMLPDTVRLPVLLSLSKRLPDWEAVMTSPI